MNIIEKYLEKPYWVIDLLPKQVPFKCGGQYFKIEKYILKHQKSRVCKKFSDLLIKLNCYHSINMFHSPDIWTANPDPENVEAWVAGGQMVYVWLESEDALIGYTGDDHYMTLYNPSEELLELISSLAASEGLFIWKPLK